ncbi:MAG: hypothetical protein M0Q13_11095 [Methanothrix sp.]|jgi:hypothetical protein|nr:hypothetical protein [Methanothrix sp.]
MAAEPSTIEIHERKSSAGFRCEHEDVLLLGIINLQVDYEDGLWIDTLPPLDAAASSQDFQEARQMLFEYIDFLWKEYVLCSVDELGETGKRQRDLLLELFPVN